MRQAVLIIHGIGEQRPMGTLRGFVQSLVGSDAYRSKPDRISNSYELRMLSHKTGDLRTDFYEYYWAYRFQDSKISHLIAWSKELLTAKYIPLRLKRIRTLLYWAMIFLVIIFISILFIIFGDSQGIIRNLSKIFSTAAVLGSILLFFFGNYILGYGADAARYLNSAPDNIAERQLIKKDGIEILKSLQELKNDKGNYKYDRIIIVGHSLGSVIGYDIIKHSWIDYNKKVSFLRSQASVPIATTEIETIEKLEKTGSKLCKIYQESKDKNKPEHSDFLESVAKFQVLQGELWTQQILEQLKWRVSHFITLGSPLTHADFLLSKKPSELNDRINQRELPVCPPTDADFDLRDNIDRKYTYDKKKNSIHNLHHAAMFAITKWTNLYFNGDIIGGRVGQHFGFGVKDIEARINNDLNLHDKKASHVRYWQEFDQNQNESLKELRRIILSKEEV